MFRVSSWTAFAESYFILQSGIRGGMTTSTNARACQHGFADTPSRVPLINIDGRRSAQVMWNRRRAG
ncbi:MAG: hypothetical protein AUG51_14205 [Acidobacteria bacterium 13_1_20CM_3_53_8]|nr:MAG: hypothetical protein AUG51_14205 [Acidobacteria bacterium 13_1_20CM_3_53_8]